MTSNVCMLCKFSRVEVLHAGTPREIQVRLCARRAPSSGQFPKVRDNDWCGEFERRSDWETQQWLRAELKKEFQNVSDPKTRDRIVEMLWGANAK